MRCLLVEDDPIARTVLAHLVTQHGGLTLVDACESATEALAVLARASVDLVLLDIEMPGPSGLELARRMPKDVQTIIVTGKEEYAFDAFDHGVADYLLKPVDAERFARAVSRAQRLASEAQSAPDGDSGFADGPVFVRSEGRLVRLDLSAVSHIEARKDYVVFHTPDQAVLVHATMKAMEEKLPPSFVRIHRSTIIRLDKISDVSDGQVRVGTAVLPVGASYRDGLMERLQTL